LALKDFILAPIALTFFYALLYFFKKRLTTQETTRYFIPAFTLKVIGAISLGLIYHFYYSGGDTVNYFSDGKVIYTALMEDFLSGLDLLFREVDPDSMINYKYRSHLIFYRDPHSYFVSRIIAIISLFCMNSYSAIAIVFAAFSFVGNWAMYRVFIKLYPSLYKELAIAILFLPSVVFWGSGIMKDSITFGAIGLLFYSFHYLLVEKRFTVRNLVLLLFSMYLIFSIKIYILICFLPPMLIWLFLRSTDGVKNKFYLTVLKPLFLIGGMVASFSLINKITEDDDKYSLETIGKTAETTADWLDYKGKLDGGSNYSFGEVFDGSPSSAIRLAPQSFVVTYFRPFPWEVRNPVMLLSALESFGVLLYFFYAVIVIIKFKPKFLFNPPRVVMVFTLFALVFGIAIGMTSMNFGTLVRYKIPSLPFFVAGMIILVYESKRKRSAIFQP